jgi:alkanesulfonate monooxygenase SsuD/methylene tetrahydromethanopterin reductase-like flavin-dependent oxidoreductase (luciferase family)
VAHTVCCGRSAAELERRAAAIGRSVADLRTGGLTGTPAEVADAIATYAGIGAQRVYLQILDLHDLDHLDLIASEVVPLLG